PELEAARQLLTLPAEHPARAAEAEGARALRLQLCAYLLDAGLANSRLPAPAQEALRRQFAGRDFQPSELTGAIEAQRQLVAALTAGAIIQGPGRLSATFNDRDRLQAAVDDLLGAPRDQASQALAVQPLSGIRELYLMLTGDVNLHGGYF